ncbi:unnamed protein product, partial [Staurois parvus]
MSCQSAPAVPEFPNDQFAPGYMDILSIICKYMTSQLG